MHATPHPGLIWPSLAALALALAPFGAHAQAGPPAAPEPLWEIGAVGFGLSQQAWPGSRETIGRAIALPYLLYRGPWLRIDRGALGVRAVKRPDFELDVGFSGSLGTNAKDSVARSGMPSLGTLVEFGPRGRWELGSAPLGGQWRVEVPLRGVFDVSDRFSFQGLALEPELQYRQEDLAGWRLTVGAGGLFADRQLAGTFYDVSPAYATGLRPAYEARAGLIAWRLGLSASRRVSRDWRVFGFGRYDSVAGATNVDSPLVSRTGGFTAGVGLQWTWMRSQQPAAD